MMNRGDPLSYVEVGAAGIDAIGPLWEKLRAYHARLPWPFAEEMQGVAFGPRRRELVEKGERGRLRVEVARVGGAGEVVAYCASSVSPDGRGEVDSIYVDEPWRGRGVGTELVRRSLAWMDAAGATSKVVAVAYANEQAMALYERFGFRPRTVVMKRVERDGDRDAR